MSKSKFQNLPILFGFFFLLCILSLGIGFSKPPNGTSRFDSRDQQVNSILKESCFDCHSTVTQWPFYSRFFPISYFLESHVSEGKAELNFDEFADLSPEQKLELLKKIETILDDGTMPPDSYTWMHENSRLTENEIRVLEEWVSKEISHYEKKIE